MAISETQKVDYLWKKLAYGLSKTDTNANKRATNESIASPLLLSGENVWSQSDLIPATMPGSSSGVVTVYPTSSPDETTADASATTNRTWKTGLTDWISPEFGSTYLVKVYIHTAGQSGSAASSGTQVFGAGSGNDDEWFFDYQSGILHFIGTNLPSGISGKSIYVSGARYTGIKGVAVPGAGATFTTLSVSGLSTFSSNVDINAGLDVDGLSDLDELNVSGVTTFTDTVSFGTSAYFGDNDILHFGDGQDLKIYHTGSISYISDQGTGALRIIGNQIRIRNATDNEQIANFTQNGSVELYHDNSLKFETTGVGVSIVNGTSDTATIYGPSNLIIDPMPIGVGTTSGIVRIKGDLYVDGTTTQINSSTIQLADFVVGIATTATSNALADGAGIEIGPSNINFKYYYNSNTNPSLKSSENLNIALNKVYQIDQVEVLSSTTLGSGVVNSSLTNVGTLTELNVSGISTFGSDLDINASIDISGISTFSSSVDINAGLDVDGFTELDATNISETLSVSGLSTFSSNVDINAGLDVDGFTELDGVNVSETLSVSGLSTFSSNVDVNANLDVDGFTELDSTNISETLSVSGLSTFSSNVDINASVDISTDLTVDGFTELDSTNISETLSVSGLSTFSSNVDINAGLDVDGFTELDSTNISETLSVSGLSTFSSNVDINAGLDVDGFTELDSTNISETLSVSGISTFSSLVDINAGLDVDGFTELDSTNISETLSVSGLSTFSSNVDVNASVDINNDLTVHGDIDIDTITTTSAVTATLSTTTETAVHSGLSTATYRSVEYTIQVTEGTNYHSTKILAVHDGTTAYHSEYGTVYTNSSVATFDVDLNGGNIRLLATGSTSNSTVYKIYFTATKL